MRAIPLILASALCAGQSVQSNSELFPMQKGTRWVYRGEVAWQTGSGLSSVRKKRLDWTMEVVDRIDRGPYQAALLLGHPMDLAWYEEETKRGWHILIAVEHFKFYLCDYAPSTTPARLELTETDL